MFCDFIFDTRVLDCQFDIDHVVYWQYTNVAFLTTIVEANYGSKVKIKYNV
jgi:hypothetical protein